jgi:hypothetical protein
MQTRSKGDLKSNLKKYNRVSEIKNEILIKVFLLEFSFKK